MTRLWLALLRNTGSFWPNHAPERVVPLLLAPRAAARALMGNARKSWPPNPGHTGRFLRTLAPRTAALVLFAVITMGQTPQYCDAELMGRTNPKDVDKYMERGGRCEGLYAEQVSLSGNLLVASLTAGWVAPNAWAGPLTVRCGYKESADVHIQAFLLQPRPYYRLDTLQRGSVISWNWDTEVISKYAKPANVGLVAWTSAMVGGRTQRVYLPVIGREAGLRGAIALIVLSPVAVSEVSVTVVSTAPGEKPLRHQASVGKGSYLKNERIEIEISPLPHEGLYRVEVNGRSDVGSVSVPGFLIYSAGK